MVFSTKFRWFGRKSEFQYPLGDAPRTALLANWFNASRLSFRDKGLVRVCANYADAAAFAPAAVAGTREQLLNLDPSAFPALSHAIIALARPEENLLTQEERDWLWRSFQVPVFEQVIGTRGELLASECEAHNGLHFQPDWTPGAVYTLDCSACSCGSDTPRLFPSKQIHRVALAGLAS